VPCALSYRPTSPGKRDIDVLRSVKSYTLVSKPVTHCSPAHDFQYAASTLMLWIVVWGWWLWVCLKRKGSLLIFCLFSYIFVRSHTQLIQLPEATGSRVALRFEL
jgi:hypothetical protein